MEGLDTPTIFRVGSPTLGIPMLEGPSAAPHDLLGPLQAAVADHAARLLLLEAHLAYLRLHWWQKLYRWLASWRLART